MGRIRENWKGRWRMKRGEKAKKAILWAFIMAVLGAVVPRRMKHDL